MKYLNFKHLVIGVIISLILGPIIIPELKKLKIGQTIRTDGPQSHLKKSGTPTMGGIIFILSTIITMLILGIDDNKGFICLLSFIGFGLIGFIDDYLIVIKKDNEGLTPSQKFIAQIVVSVIVMFLVLKNPKYKDLYIPFLGNKTVNFGVFSYPIILFIILGTVNSVNLTDGLDGLASSVSVVGLIAFSIISAFRNVDIVAKFAMALAGGLLGFLRYNKFPAKVFMGDVGSLAIGGAFAAIALTTQTSLYLPFIGFIFVIETLSVIIQVASFKLTGKRVLLMSPLHHHFEAIGWSEVKIVRVFYFITAIISVITVISGIW